VTRRRHWWVLPVVIAAGVLRVSGSLLTRPTWIRTHASRENWSSPRERLWKIRITAHGFGFCESIRIRSPEDHGRVLGISDIHRVPAGENVTFFVAVPVKGENSRFEVVALSSGRSQREIVQLGPAAVP